MNSYFILQKSIRKASKSSGRYKISAIGINYRGEIIGSAFNTPRFHRKGGGNHAELNLIKRCGKDLKTIILCRVGGFGNLLPIHPCKTCQTKADELGIKIITVDKLLK